MADVFGPEGVVPERRAEKQARLNGAGREGP